MKTFTRDYRMTLPDNDQFSRYFGKWNPCVFDIETTGFSGGRSTSRVILTAMLVPIEGGVRVTQFLAETPYEENRVLDSTMQFFRDQNIHYLITYNGISFDIPFMNNRLEALHMEDRLYRYDFDLYAWLRKNSTLPSRLRSLSQKSVERYFGLGSDREDRIDGGESVRLYYEYVKNGSGMLEKIILTHNREDVIQLWRLLCILRRSGFDDLLRRDTFDEAMAIFGFPAGANAEYSVTPMVNRKRLQVRGKQHQANPYSAAIYPNLSSEVSATFRSKTRDFELMLPLQAHEDSLYIDMRTTGLSMNALPPILSSSDNLVNDYLILVEDGVQHHREINALSAQFLSHWGHLSPLD